MKKGFIKLLLLTVLAATVFACIGDRKSIAVEDLGDTSFVNEDFKGNAIDYQEGMSACDRLDAAVIAELYGVSTEQVVITDPTKSDRFDKTLPPSCKFHVLLSDQMGDHLVGTIGVVKEVGKDEMMGEIAEAAGNGENWQEAWALKKSMRESTEWIEDMGKAALWTGKKRRLEIKFDGYTLTILAPGAPFNPKEQEKNRDYKSIAIAIAEAAGFLK